MEKNTVIIDLDRYEELMVDNASNKDYIRILEGKFKDNVLVSMDDFYISENYSGESEFNISSKVVEQMIDKIGGYKIIEKSGLKDIKINSYYFKLEKEGGIDE